jgi:hypothetical protein
VYVVLFRVGFLVAYLAGLGLPSKDANIDFKEHHYWQFMLCVPLIVVALQTVMLLTVFRAETPRFLHHHDKNADCEVELSKVIIDKDKLQEVKQNLDAEKSADASNEVTWGQLFTRVYAKGLLVIFCMHDLQRIVLHFFQQMAGGNAFMMYSTTIFKEAKADDGTALLGTIMGGVSGTLGVLLFTFMVDCTPAGTTPA